MFTNMTKRDFPWAIVMVGFHPDELYAKGAS
jgi:hypothetical protein